MNYHDKWVQEYRRKVDDLAQIFVMKVGAILTEHEDSEEFFDRWAQAFTAGRADESRVAWTELQPFLQ